jgi:hypothetical protein
VWYCHRYHESIFIFDSHSFVWFANQRQLNNGILVVKFLVVSAQRWKKYLQLIPFTDDLQNWLYQMLPFKELKRHSKISLKLICINHWSSFGKRMRIYIKGWKVILAKYLNWLNVWEVFAQIKLSLEFQDFLTFLWRFVVNTFRIMFGLLKRN